MFVSMEKLDAAFATVRNDLAGLGLLEPGRYLDLIDCERTYWPSWKGELGYVYDEGVDGLQRLVGYRPGVIYIPINASAQLYVPGDTLVDTLRHEFAHAWAWLDRPFINGRWFERTFGGKYDTPAWNDGEPPPFDRTRFVSEYATTQVKEDFAETFMWYLKYRRSLERLSRRPRLRKKVETLAGAIDRAARTRVNRRIRLCA